MTGQDCLNGAGRLIGELRGDRSFGVVESTQLLVKLNQMISAWSAAGDMLPQLTRESVTLTGAATYAIPVRPLRIKSAETISAAGVRMPTRICTAETWPQFVDEAETGSFIDCILPDYGFPSATVRAWPLAPSGSLILYSLKPMAGFTLAVDTAFPSGYEEAITYSFAVQIAPEFGRQASETVVAVATASRGKIAEMNTRILESA